MIRVLVTCECGYALVIDDGASIRLRHGSWRIYKDTGKIVANCRRCPREHVIDAGRAVATEPGTEDVVTRRVRVVTRAVLAGVG